LPDPIFQFFLGKEGELRAERAWRTCRAILRESYLFSPLGNSNLEVIGLLLQKKGCRVADWQPRRTALHLQVGAASI